MRSRDEKTPGILISHLGYGSDASKAVIAVVPDAPLTAERDHTRSEYLAAARESFAHLEQHNLASLFDGTESIIDDYAAP